MGEGGAGEFPYDSDQCTVLIFQTLVLVFEILERLVEGGKEGGERGGRGERRGERREGREEGGERGGRGEREGREEEGERGGRGERRKGRRKGMMNISSLNQSHNTYLCITLNLFNLIVFHFTFLERER